MFFMGGTSRIWTQHAYGSWLQLVGSPNAVTAWQICKGPRHVGTSLQSNRAYSWNATVDRAPVLVVWGGGAELSNYDDSCRTMVDAAAKAEKFIIVDPRMTNLGKEADIWLPLRPGTDAAMALGWLNVIVNNKLYDEMWVKRWTDLPYLVVEDMEATETAAGSRFNGDPLKTKLLKESDIVEVVSDASTETVLFGEMPVKTNLRVTHSEPGIKGDTATNTLKPATLETGVEIRVPLFVNEGDLVQVDTRDGSYLQRVKE